MTPQTAASLLRTAAPLWNTGGIRGDHHLDPSCMAVRGAWTIRINTRAESVLLELNGEVITRRNWKSGTRTARQLSLQEAITAVLVIVKVAQLDPTVVI